MSEAPAKAPALLSRLSVMMFLQYAIWGAWLPLFYQYLTEHIKLTDTQTGMLFAIGATGALAAPFLAGQIADRWLSTEKLLGISHIAGAAMVWQLATLTEYNELLIFSLLYSIIYSPTLSLTNSLAFHHLPDRDRDFGRVRVWGTVGWIAVGIGIGQWLLRQHTPEVGTDTEIAAAQVAGMADAFRLSAILGFILGIYCFFLPHTPPQRGEKKFAPAEALSEVRQQPLLALFLIAFPVSCIHQFYFVQTGGFLNKQNFDAPIITTIFGVGGGGLMTIGQMSEIFVVALMPFVLKKVSRKSLLLVGLSAYALRFAVFAFVPELWAVIPALALHGLCFGCFFFIAFMIVDEETTADVRASAQGLFNLIVVGFGVIAGNYAAGEVAAMAKSGEETDFGLLFGIPMGVALLCLLGLWLIYPNQRRQAA